MKRNKSLYKILLIIFISLTFILATVSLKQTFVKKSGILINTKELAMIKNFFTQTGSFDGSNLKLTQIEGDKDVLNLKFTHPSLSGHYYTHYALYNVQKHNLITVAEHEDISINMITSQYIGQANKDVFLTIDSNGTLYSLKFTSSKDYEIHRLADLNIAKNDIQDIMFSENNLYILTRDYLNNFNEKTLSSGVVYKISFDKKYKNADVSKIELEEDTIPVKFVLNSEKNVGYISIDTLEVPVEYGNTYSTSLDKDYLRKIASRDNNYRLLKLDSYKITFLDGSTMDIDNTHYSSETTSFTKKVNKDYNIETGSIFGVPIFIDSINNKTIMIEEYLHNSISYYNPSRKCLIYSITDGEVDYGTYDTNFVSFSPSFNDKYIGYIYTEIGTIGILKDGSYERITFKGVAFVNKKTIIFENNDSICFAKTV